jgi:hypothetical protein
MSCLVVDDTCLEQKAVIAELSYYITVAFGCL